MSQHHHTTTVGDKPVKLVLGWDRMLREYFYSVYDMAPGVDDDILGTSTTLNQDQLKNLDVILEELKSMGITPPEKMVTEARADEVNNIGNRLEFY